MVPPVGATNDNKDIRVNGRNPELKAGQTTDRYIDDLLTSIGCENDQRQEVKKLIYENLNGKSTYLSNPPAFPKKSQYIALKAYSTMFNSLGLSVNMPGNWGQIPDDKAIDFLVDYQIAANSFANGRTFTGKLQKKLFEQYAALSQKKDQGPDEKMKEASLVYAYNSVPIARITVEKGVGVPSAYLKAGSVMALADESNDPLYAAVKDEVKGGTRIDSGSIVVSVWKDLGDHLKDMNERLNKLQKVLSVPDRKAALKKAVSLEETLKGKVSPKTGLLKALDYKDEINELYGTIKIFYGEEGLNELFKKVSSGIGDDEGLTLSEKWGTMELALKEYSLKTLNEGLQALGEAANIKNMPTPAGITPLSASPEANFNNIEEISNWYSSVKKYVSRETDKQQDPGKGEGYQIARRYFIYKCNRELGADEKDRFKINLALLESGTLSYETVQNNKIGVAMPVRFTAGRKLLKLDLISFDAGGDDPVITVAAECVKPLFKGDVSSLSGKDMVKTYLKNLDELSNKEEGSNKDKLTSISLLEIYQKLGRGETSSVYNPALRAVYREDNQTTLDNQEAIRMAAVQTGSSVDPIEAVNLLKPLSEKEDLWIISGKGQSDMTAVSQKVTQDDFLNARKAIEAALRMSDPLAAAREYVPDNSASNPEIQNIALTALKYILSTPNIAKSDISSALDLLSLYAKSLDGKEPDISRSSAAKKIQEISGKQKISAGVSGIAISLLNLILNGVVSSNFKKTREALETLLKVHDPFAKTKFNFIEAAAGFRNDWVLFDPDAIALKTIESLMPKQGKDPSIDNEILGKAADLLNKYIEKLGKNALLNTPEDVLAKLVEMESDGKVIALAVKLFNKILELDDVFSKQNISSSDKGSAIRILLKNTLEEIKSWSGNEGVMAFMNENALKGGDFVIINRSFVSSLMGVMRNRMVARDVKRTDAPATKQDVLKVTSDDPMAGLVTSHSILAMKLYLSRYSSARSPIEKDASGYYAVEELTSNDIQAYITMISKRTLREKDIEVLKRVRDLIRDGKASICDLDFKWPGTDGISKNMNRALQLLRNFRDDLERLTEVQEPLAQRAASQIANGQKVTSALNLARTVVKGVGVLPNFAAQNKAQNMVFDGYVLALKQQFAGSAMKVDDTAIDGDFIEKFCDQYGALLFTPTVDEISGSHPEYKIAKIKNAGQFLRELAKKMKDKGEQWESLNFNTEDFNDENMISAKIILQAAMLRYKPGMQPRTGELAGKAAENLDALMNYFLGVSMGPFASNNNAIQLKTFLFQHNKIDKHSISFLDDEVNQATVKAAGKIFADFLKEYDKKTDAEKIKLIEDLESDPMNRFSIEGKTALDKFRMLETYADELQAASFEGTLSFSYDVFGTKNDYKTKLMLFVRTILPSIVDMGSAGADKQINFGTALYALTGGGKVRVKGREESDTRAEKIKSPSESQMASALTDQVYYNYLNFKFLMMPTIQLQMQAGFIAQMALIANAAAHGDPYAACDLRNARDTWLNTRAQFIAYKLNPLAWFNPFPQLGSSEFYELWKEKKYPEALAYTAFFGPMAVNMVKQMAGLYGRPALDRVLATIDQWKGRRSEVSLNITNAISSDPQFQAEEERFLDENIPGFKKILYRSSYAAGVGRDVVINTFDKIGETRLARYIETLTNKHVWRYGKKGLAKAAGLIDSGVKKVSGGRTVNPQTVIQPNEGVISFEDWCSLAKDRTAEWRFEINTPLKHKDGTLILDKNGIPKVRRSIVTLSALDVFKLAAEPAKAEHVFGTLWVKLPAGQKNYILNEIRSSFSDFKSDVTDIFDGLRQRSFPAENVAGLCNKIKNGDSGTIGALRASGLTEQNIQSLKSQAELYLAVNDPGQMRSFIDGREKELISQGENMLKELKAAADAPARSKIETIYNTDLPGRRPIDLSVRNIDMLAVIESSSDPSVLQSIWVNPGMRVGLYKDHFENIFNDNRLKLVRLISGMTDAEKTEFNNMLQRHLVQQPKGIQEYLLSSGDGNENMARILLSKLLQENKVAPYTKIFRNGFIRNLLLMNKAQMTIRGIFRRANYNMKMILAGKKAATVPQTENVPAGLTPVAGDTRYPAAEKLQVPGTNTGKPLELPGPKTKPFIVSETFGKEVPKSVAGALLYAGGFSLGGAFMNIVHNEPVDVKDLAFKTMSGAGFGVATMAFASALSRLGTTGSWTAAGFFTGLGMSVYTNWGYLKTSDLGMWGIGSSDIAVDAVNGGLTLFTGAAWTAGVTAASKNPALGLAAGLGASSAMGYGLTTVENGLANAPLPLSGDSKSLAQIESKYKLEYFFRQIKSPSNKEGIGIKFHNAARKDGVTEAVQSNKNFDEFQAVIENDITFKESLINSGIVKIKADAPADINLVILQKLMEKAAEFKIEQNVKNISVEMGSPQVRTYKEGRIAVYDVTMLAPGKKPRSFQCSMLLEGDPVATNERLELDIRKGQVDLKDLLVSHASISLKDIDDFPALKEHIGKILLSSGYPAQGDIKQSLTLFLEKERGLGQSSLDASNAAILLSKELTGDQLAEELKKSGKFDLTEATSILQMGQILQRMSYLDGRSTVTYKQTSNAAHPLSTLEVSIPVKVGGGTISFNPNIFDPDVFAVQSALNALGYLDAKYVNGYFGGTTSKALQNGKFVNDGFASYSIDKKVIKDIAEALYYHPFTLPRENWKQTKARLEKKETPEPKQNETNLSSALSSAPYYPRF